jgi:hypothetical protein
MSENIQIQVFEEDISIRVTPSVVTLVEVGLQGPAGAASNLPGPPGAPGDLGGIEAADGDIIRFNEQTGGWESAAEPFEFKGIILTPLGSPLSAVEGSIYYRADDNGLYVSVP